MYDTGVWRSGYLLKTLKTYVDRLSAANWNFISRHVPKILQSLSLAGQELRGYRTGFETRPLIENHTTEASTIAFHNNISS